MRNSGVPGSRSWLISQMRHGVHVEESATVVTGRGDMPCALALLDTRLTGICKPHMETLQQFLSSGADMNCELDIKLTDIADIKVRKDFMAHRESIGGKACPEVVYIFHGREDRASCK